VVSWRSGKSLSVPVAPFLPVSTVRARRPHDMPDSVGPIIRRSRLVKVSISDCARERARDIDIEDLFNRARAAQKRAYAPYSNFRVGAALLVDSGEIITGGNVENGSYGLTICAERSAVVRAVAEGHRDFTAIAVAGDTDRAHTLPPCGACLQVLAEFDSENPLVVIFPDGGLLRIACVSELLPISFHLRND